MRRLAGMILLVLVSFALSAPAVAQAVATRTGSDVQVNFTARGGACSKLGPARIGAPESAIRMENATAVTVTMAPTGVANCAQKPGMWGYNWRITIPNVPKSTRYVVVYVIRGTGRKYARMYAIEN